jgi:hypothetical protein
MSMSVTSSSDPLSRGELTFLHLCEGSDSDQDGKPNEGSGLRTEELSGGNVQSLRLSVSRPRCALAVGRFAVNARASLFRLIFSFRSSA